MILGRQKVILGHFVLLTYSHTPTFRILMEINLRFVPHVERVTKLCPYLRVSCVPLKV